MFKIKVIRVVVVLDGEIGCIENGDFFCLFEIDLVLDYVCTMCG